MGYINNHSIIVTSWDKKSVEKAHKKATQLFDEIVSNITPSKVNRHFSFAILPDGSKEGWSESNECDKLRNDFIKWIKTLDYEDGSNPLNWVEVSFDEQGIKKIVRYPYLH